jgi:hypothetical protein
MRDTRDRKRYRAPVKRSVLVIFFALVAPAALVAVLIHAPGSAAAAASATSQAQTSRVVLVLAPNLRWEDISATATPELHQLIGQGAVGNINARSRTHLEGAQASPLEGALTISAGSWASPAPLAPAAYDADERYEGGTATEGYRRIMGRGMGYDAIAFLGLPMTQRYNEQLSVGVRLGVLGQAIEDAGGTTAAVGNSDAGAAGGSAAQKLRPAALAAMDEAGLVRFGDVSQAVLKNDPNAPYGTTTDVDVVRTRLVEIGAALRGGVVPGTGEGSGTGSQGPGGPNLTVIDPGDTYRAARLANVVADGVAEQHRTDALQVLDRVVGAARDALPDDGVLIVASQIPGVADSGTEGFGPVIVVGPGWSGYLSSSSTHRTGLVTNLDVTATVLNVLGVPEPVEVEGNPMMTVASSAADGRVPYLRRASNAAVAIDSAKTGVTNDYIVVTTLLFLASTLVLLRVRPWPEGSVRRWCLTLRWLLLAVLTVPPASWLMFAFVRWPASRVSADLTLLVVALGLFAFAALFFFKSPLRVPVAFLSLLMALVAMADQWFGAPLSFSTFFGYSPLAGARYYGMGNESAAALVGATLVGTAYLLDQWPGSSFARAVRVWGIPVLGLAAVVSASAPFLGANVGVVAWGIVAFGVFWALANGRRPGWRFVVVGILLIVLIVAVFSAIDLLGGGEQTHLGRAIVSAERGGPAQLWDIVVRKAATNLRVFAATRWVYLLVVVLAFLAYMRWRPQGEFAETLKANPHLGSAIAGVLAGGTVAFFTEDSGIIIPAIMLIWVGAGILYVMLAEAERRSGEILGEQRVPEVEIRSA